MFSSIDESNDSFFYPFIVVFNVADVPRNRPTELAPVLPVFLPLEIPQKHGKKNNNFLKKILSLNVTADTGDSFC